MLGMRRGSSLHLVESERSPSKLPKEDALSIYEGTLQKLRDGSRHAFASVKGMKCETISYPGNASSNGGDNLSTVNLERVETNKD